MHSASNNYYINVHFLKGFINVYFVLIYQFTVLSKSLVSVIYLFWDINYLFQQGCIELVKNVKTFIILQRINISNKCYSLERSIH